MEMFLHSGMDNIEDFMADLKHRASAEGRIEHQRNMAFGRNNGRLIHFTNALDERLEALINEQKKKDGKKSVFPAVDLASGAGFFVEQLALKYHPWIEWYPTEWRADAEDQGPLDRETRAGLKHLFKEAKKEDTPLFPDSSGNFVFPNQIVKLTGLSKTEFNGLKGKVLNVDPHARDRFGVLVENREKPISLKGSNLLWVDVPENCLTLQLVMRRTLVCNGEADAFYNGLLERSCEVDLLNRETWNNVSTIEGRCAVVTATSILTCMGYREPLVWKDTMTLASKLLASNGILLQYDTEMYGGFANVDTMEAFVRSGNLGLKLEERSEPVRYDDECGRMFLLVWRKE